MLKEDSPGRYRDNLQIIVIDNLQRIDLLIIETVKVYMSTLIDLQ